MAGGGIPALIGANAEGCVHRADGLDRSASGLRAVSRRRCSDPVCSVLPFDDEDEAVQLANDSAYGLAASIWTDQPQARSSPRRAASKLASCGSIHWFLRDLRTPFGGSKLSGIGREGGRHSLDFYSEIRNVCVNCDCGWRRRAAARRNCRDRIFLLQGPAVTDAKVVENMAAPRWLAIRTSSAPETSYSCRAPARGVRTIRSPACARPQTARSFSTSANRLAP